METNTDMQANLADKRAILAKGLATIESIEKRRKESRWFTGESASKKTILDYKKIAIRLERKTRTNKLFNAEDLIVEAKKTTSQNYWFKRKAAIIYCASMIIKLHASRFNSWLKSKQTIQNKAPDDLIDKWKLENNYLIRVTEILNLIEQEKWIKDEAPNNKKKIVNSKKDILRFLPEDWRERILNEVPYRYRLPVLTAIVSGCRPAELKNGVFMELDERGLVITIKGVKIKQHAGQNERVLTFSINNDLTRELATLIGNDNGLLRTEIYNCRDFTKIIQSAAKRSIPNLKYSVTAYCFRHQFAADFKSDLKKLSCTLTIADLAGSLGHLTDEMQRKYGHIRQSKSKEGTNLISVKTDRVVKNKLKTPYHLRLLNLKSPSPRI